MPAFMAKNSLVPSARSGCLTISHMEKRLHRFAVRFAGLRSMFQQVSVQVGLRLSQEECLHPWMQEHSHHRVQRAAALAVVSMGLTLDEAGTPARLGPMLQVLRVRASRPSAASTSRVGVDRIEGYGSSRYYGARPLPLSESMPVRPRSPVSPPSDALREGDLRRRSRTPAPGSDAPEAGDLSRARIYSLAALSKAKAAATPDAAPSRSSAACPASSKASGPRPRPPTAPPPDALSAGRELEAGSPALRRELRARPRPSRQTDRDVWRGGP